MSICKSCGGYGEVDDGRGNLVACQECGGAVELPIQRNDVKLTNPKDALSSDRAPLELCPDTLLIGTSMAFLEGALKYGRYNWRVAGVRASVYMAALRRHMSAWWNGEDIDTKSGLPHLYKASACIAILIDASVLGMLKDDRPPKADVAKMLDDMEAHVKRLRVAMAQYNPKQYTIADSK